MSNPPEGFVELLFKGITRVPTPERAIATILMESSDGQTIAIPLDDVEEVMFRRNQRGVRMAPQPYQLMAACLNELGAGIDSIRILYTPELNFTTRLILYLKEGAIVEVDAFGSDAIACALNSGAPIYAEQKLLTEIGTSGFGTIAGKSEHSMATLQ